MSLKIKRGMGKRKGKIDNSLIFFLIISSIFIAPLVFASGDLISDKINQSKVKISLEYNKNSSYDADNDGIENLDGIVDFNVGNTEIDESLNESNLCTRWNVYSVENESSLTLCYGNDRCCNFIGMNSLSEKWDDVFYLYYGKYGATNNNEVSAQVIYVDYSLEEENPYSNVYYSEISSLDAAFRKERITETKINSYIEKQEISKGEIQVVYSGIRYVNNTPVSHVNLSFYLNNNLFETKTTDENGEALFEIDTSGLNPGNYSIDVKFNGLRTQKWNETIVLMPSSNETAMKAMPSNNESIYVTEHLKQGDAEIGKQVKWTKRINLENFANESRDVNLDFEVPEEAENVVVKKDDKEIDEKRKGILSALLSLGRSEDGPLFEFSGTSKNKKNFVIKDKLNKSKTEYNIEYETPAPKKDEIFNVNGNAIKRVKIHSDVSFHYHNIKSYSEIPEGIENLRIYHLINNSKIDVTDNPDYDVVFIDSNENGLYDKVEWNVPMLSEQLFEIGVATVNTNKSIYHPGEEAEIIMVVLDSLGRLVSDADVELIITSPSNETSHYSTSEQTIVETEEGIYEASYSETDAEGNYSLFVRAISDDVNSTMNSYFTVKDYYGFDILREIPVTTDPWIGDFDSSIRLISYNGNDVFDFYEVIPLAFNVTDEGGSTITETENKKILRWDNVENNSVISYSARSPLISPEVYEIGKSYVDYRSGIFNEARPWYLAVDPINTYYGANSSDYSNYCSDNTNGLISYTRVDDNTNYYRMGRLRSNTAALDWPTADKAFLDIHVQGDTSLMTQIDIVWDGYCAVSKGAGTNLQIAWYDWDSDTYTNFDDDDFACGGEPGTNPSVSISTSEIDDALNGSQYLRVAFSAYSGNKGCPDGTDVYHDQIYITVTTLADNAPLWYKNESKIVATYNPSTTSYFNVSWNDTVGVNTVWIESNYSGEKHNYSMTRLSGDENSGLYQYSKILPAGIYYWQSHANDTKDQWNSTYNWTFEIERASPGITLTLNGSQEDIDIEEDNYLWLNGTKTSSDNQNLKLYMNGTLVNDNPSPISNYTLFTEPGYYNITLIYEQNTNYSYESDTYFVNVSDVTAPNVTLVGPPNNAYSKTLNVNFTYNVSDYSNLESCTIDLNSGQYRSSNTSYVNKSKTNNFYLPGLPQTTINWFIECTDLSTGQLTGYSKTWTVKIDATAPTLSYIIPPTPENNSFQNQSSVVINVSHTEVNPSNPDTIILYVNGAENKTQGYEAGSNKFTNFSLDLDDGEYKFSVFINDSAGNNNTLSNLTVNIDTVPPKIDYDATNPVDNYNQSQDSFVVNATHSEENSDNIILYINESLNKSQIYSGSFTNFSLANIGDGVYNYYVWLNDSARNQNKTQSRTITIDSTAPKLFLESPQNDTWSTTEDNNLRYNTTDSLLGVDNCSLIIDGNSNQTNQTVNEGDSQTFNVNLGNSMGYYWRIDCADKLNNINNSETRLIKVDTTYPQVSNENINGSNFDVNKYICLNLTVTDTFSDVKNITVTIDYPSGLKNVTFSNNSGICGNSGGITWAYKLNNNEEGEYNWTETYAEDFAGNVNSTSPKTNLNWSAESYIFINVTMDEPSSNIELDESTSQNNNSFSMVCNATCRPDSSEGCNNVFLFAEYYDNGWKEINTETTTLINNLDNSSCGNLSIGEKCSDTFNITIGKTAGGNMFDIQCKGTSSNAPNDYSDAVNLIVNDFPVAAFSYPENGSYLHETEILNASVSTDDQSIANYIFELDNNTNFESSTELCSGASHECSFNTITENDQCDENSFDCFIRLNVTDSDGLKNSTYISVQIDNTNPYVNLDEPFNNNWESSNSIQFKYTPYDLAIDSCALYHNSSGWKENETNNNEQDGVQKSFNINLNDGSYLWNVWCNDSAGNNAFNSTSYTVNVDSTYPKIEFSADTEKNNTYFNLDWVYMNVSIDETNQDETIFYLYNSTLNLLDNHSTNDPSVNSPSSCSGDWIQCDGAYSDGGASAIADSGNLGMQLYNFGFSISSGTIEGIEVMHDSWDPEASSSLNISLSWDGGNSWTSEKTRSLADTETTYTEGSSTDAWGRTWNADEINSNTNFRVRFVTDGDSEEWDVDYVKIKVYYSSTSFNFTNLNDDMVYYYKVSINDSAGNDNFTETRKITLDDTYPKIDFSDDTEENDTYFNRDWVYANVTITESNVNKTMFYLYNSTLHLVNNTNITNGLTYVNFTNLNDVNGEYYYNVTVVDEIGFENSTETRKITLDDTDIIINLNEPSDWTFTTSNNIMFNYTPIDTNLDNCSLYGNFSETWNINQTHPNPVSETKNSFDSISLNDDYYIWNVKCYDKAGNSAFNNTNYTLVIDSSAPTEFNLISPSNNTYSKDRTPLLNWTEPIDPHFDNYTIFFDDNSNFGSINNEYYTSKNISNTSLQIQAINQLGDNTLFYWKILAYDNLSNNRNSTEIFIYATDNQKPEVKLESPEDDDEITSSFLVDFYYNVSDNFNVRNCSLIVDKSIKETDSSVSMSTTQEISAILTNGDHNWSINCTDYAGNVDNSEIRNVSVNVAIPKLRFYETATGAVSESSVQYINLSTSNEANADRVTISPGPGTTGLYTFDVATFGDDNQVGPNGLLIPASTSITFDGNFQGGRTNGGYARWKLEYNNGSGYTEICNVQTNSYVPTTETNMNAECTSPDYEIYLDTDDALRLSVYFNKVDSRNFDFYHDWDQPDNSGFDIYAYLMGYLLVNISSPEGTYKVNESDSFNATCNVTCKEGHCHDTDVYIQQRISDEEWTNINTTSGNLIYTSGTNPTALGQINSTNLVNFTLSGNQISKDTNIRCIATSDYSNVEGTKTANIIVNDYIYPTVSLNNPKNESWDNDGNVIFYYTPNDNYNVSNCSLIINQTINQTNHTITEGIQNNFTLNNMGSGVYEWKVNCTDSFDNTNNSKTRQINIDIENPLIKFTVNTEENDTYFNRNWIYAEVSVTEDDFANITFEIYNANRVLINSTNYTNEIYSINFTNLADTNEIYYYNVTVIDSAGNKNFTETRVITLDEIKPRIDFSSDVENNNSYFNRDWVYVNVSIDDTNENATRIYLYNSTYDLIDSALYTNGITYHNFTGLSDTNEIYYYNASHTDKAGNVNSTGVMNITLDSDYPKIGFASDIEGNKTYFNRDWVYVNVSVDDTNENATRIYLYNSTYDLVDSALYTNGVTYHNFTGLVDTNEIYYYNASHTDKAGNVNSTGVMKITLDDTNPVVNLDEPNNNHWDDDGIIIFRYTPDDVNIDSCTLYHNSSEWQENETNGNEQDEVQNSFNINLNDGSYIWNIWCNDSAGNSAFNSTNYTINVDTVYPLIEFTVNTEENDTYFNRNWVYAEVSVTEDNFANITFELYDSTLNLVNSTNYTNEVYSINFTNLADANEIYYYNVTVIDGAGNENFTETRKITLDDIKPRIDFSSDVENNDSYLNRDWVYVNATVDDTNENATRIYLYNSTYDLVGSALYTNGITHHNFTGLVDTNEIYYYNASHTDKAGNVNSTGVMKITLDDINPTIDFSDTNALNNSNQSSTTLTLNVTHDETNPDIIILYWNEAQNETKAYNGEYTAFALSGLSDNEYEYYVWLNDSAGNNESTEKRTIRIDTTSPNVNLENSQNNTWKNNETQTVLFQYNVSDALLEISNCSLIINSSIDSTNYTVEKQKTQHFTKTLTNGDYLWKINCYDTVGNENSSEERLLKVDLTFPRISNENANASIVNITNYICLNATVDDAISGVDWVWSYIIKPDSLSEEIRLYSNITTSCDPSSADNVYSYEYKLNQVGLYNWTTTYSNDTAGNLNSTITGITWNSTSIGTMTVNMTHPISNFEINESEDNLNYTYNHTCVAVCDDKNQNCTEVYLHPQYNLSGGASDITTLSDYLVSFNDSYYCGNLTAGGIGCNYTFTVRTSKDTGGKDWNIWCRAESESVGSYTSNENVNISVNDHPIADFSYPSNGTWLHSTETLNASASTDDQGITNYLFQVDNRTDFSSPSTICSSDDENCSFDTTSQSQCEEESLECYLRFNITDSDDLKNSTYITIGIDNTGPTTTLIIPINTTNIISDYYELNASSVDLGSGVNTVTFMYRENITASWNIACYDDDETPPFNCTWDVSSLPDNTNYEVKVYANDVLGNFGNNDTRYNITIDMTGPEINLSNPENDTWSKENVTFSYKVNDITSEVANCSILIDGEINDTDDTIQEGSTLNFNVYHIPDGRHNWSIECYDSLGNNETSEKRLIKIDYTGPVSTIDKPLSFENISTDTYRVNATVNDSEGIGINDVYFEYSSNNGGSWNSICTDSTSPYGCDWNTAVLSEGDDYHVKVYASDNLGNVGEENISANITIDRTAPKITLENPSNETQDIDGKDILFEYSVTDNLVDIANCSLIINSTINKTNYSVIKGITQNFTLTNIGNAYYIWSINCTDNAGNENSSEQRTLIVAPDTDAPFVDLIWPENETRISYNDITFQYNVSDEFSYISNCSLFLNNTLNQSNATSIEEDSINTFTVNGIVDGDYIWKVRCWDNATNPNMNTSNEYIMTIQEATSINVSVIPDREEYENLQDDGEIANISINTKDQFGNNLETNMSASIIKANTTTPWWNSSYKYRQMINVTNNHDNVLETGYTINHTINTLIPINESKMQGDGDDLRIAYFNSDEGSLTEIDRIITNINNTQTYVLFRTQKNISSGSSDSYYYAYYGNSTVTNPPENKSNVYFYYDGFESDTINNYETTRAFDDADENDESTLSHAAASGTIRYDGTINNGKSIRREDLKIRNLEIEVEQNIDELPGGALRSYFEIGSRVSYDTYYFMSIPNENLYSAKIARYENGVRSGDLASDNLEDYSLDVYHSIKFIVYDINSTTTELMAYIDGTKVLAYNDTDNRITGYGGFGTGSVQFTGNWDNLTVKQYVPTKPTTTNGSEQEMIKFVNGETNSNGYFSFSFNTTNQSYANYSVVALAEKPPFYVDSVGYNSFEIGPDKTSPEMILNYPEDEFNLTSNTINFNWTADDRMADYIICNLTIDGSVNISDVNCTDEISINRTVQDFTEGTHYWNISCVDDYNNSNTSLTYSFTVIDKPESISANLAADNTSVYLDWADKSYSATYNIYIKDSFTDSFSSTPDVSGLSSSEWNDTNAGSYTQRFYKVETVRGDANKSSSKVLGKYEAELINNTESISDWNLVSVPLNVTEWELNNGTNNGFDFHSEPASCIISLWRYSDAEGWERTNYNGSAWNPGQGDEGFTSIESGRGYWFEVNKTCNIVFVGEVPIDNKSISLETGWNLQGWYSPNSSTLPVGGSSPYPITVNPANSVDAINRYNPTTDEFEVTIYWGSNIWWPSGSTMDFTSIEPTKGYYFDVNQAATWEHDPNT